ncbi:MAG: DUF502 domain-containing protein [Burkholderiaceae bacterium]|nr:DUF502 domain-containing protein [Burkholderiaceae bacterium]
MTRATRHLLRLFVTGLLAALPLAATVAVFAWAVSLLLQWVGPRSAFGELLGGIGLGVTGSEIVGYAIGLGIIVGAILLLGLLVERGLQHGLARIVEAVVRRIPLVRNVYDLVQRFVSLLSQREEDGTRAMQPVWVSFGGRGEPACVVLALQTTAEPVLVDGRRCVPVMVPTAPVPVGGGLMFVPEAWVARAELSVEAVTALYVSMGVTAPQHLPAARGRGSIAP